MSRKFAYTSEAWAALTQNPDHAEAFGGLAEIPRAENLSSPIAPTAPERGYGV
jgi:hypothetical protein